MIVKCLLAGAALAAISLGAARAESVQAHVVGNDLLSRCRSHVAGEQRFCLGYIGGVADIYEQLRSEQGSPPCAPFTSQAGQIRDVVIRYLEQHPEDRHQTGASLVVAAIRKAWNCE